MNYRYIPYIWPLAISGFITFSLGIYSLVRCRNSKGAKSFAVSMFIITLWSVPNALEMSAIVLPTKLFWANIQYIAYSLCPVTLLILCMQFTGYDKWLKNGRILLLIIIPMITILLVWTDKYHGLVRYNIRLDNSGIFPVISKQYGIAFYIHAVHCYILNAITLILLFQAAFVRKTIYRMQAIALLLGVSCIALPNALYILNLSPNKRFDITPVFFGPLGIFMAWCFFKYRLFDLVPIAWATVIKTMDAGVIIMDLQDRVIDINPAFERISGLSAIKIISKNVREAFINNPEFYAACKDRTFKRAEFTVKTETNTKIYEILLSTLSDEKGFEIGRLGVIYEITEKKEAEREFMRQQWKLAVSKERERMVRDMHDNLGQVLGFINIQAQAIKKELQNAGVTGILNKLDKLIDVTQSTHTELREYIREVRNSTEMEKDFMTALNKDIIYFENQTGINVSTELPVEFTDTVLAPDTRINIYNIIKEALNNIRKHADAKHVNISFCYMKDQLNVVIRDDGIGFDLTKYKSGLYSGYGLNIMKERAKDIDGQLDIVTEPGKGCSVQLKIQVVKGGNCSG